MVAIPSPTDTGNASPVSDASYATWTEDPVLDPITAEIHIPLALMLGNYLAALFLTTLCVAVRIHVRRVMVKEIALDDWVLIVAWFTFLAYVAFTLGYGLNIQVNGMVAEYWESWMLTAFWELMFVVCTICVRGAIATFFLRLLPRFEYRWQRWVIIGTFTVYTIFLIIFVFLNMWQCGNPIDTGYAYDFDPCPFGQAMTVMPILVRALTMGLDWIMTLIPIVVVLRSTMTRKAKISVSCIMILAGIGSTTSVLSIVYNDLGDIQYPSDIPHFIVYTIFSLWENATGIMVVSLAAMRPLFGKFKESLKRSTKQSDPTPTDGIYLDTVPTNPEATVIAQDDIKKPGGLLSEIRFSTRITSWALPPSSYEKDS